jgi:RND family efflux transporter MFP subunit
MISTDRRRTLLLAVLLALPLADVAHAQGDERPALVRVAKATVQSMAPVTLVPGTVTSRDDARLAAEVAGRLVEVAEVGTRVSAGDVVARIEDTVLRLRRDELAAEVTRARARVRFLDSEEQRFAALARDNLAAATQLEQTRSDRDVARGDLRVAESRLAQLDDQLARTELRAPFGGMVVERLMMPGERVDDGSNVVRLVDPEHLEVVARAPLEYYGFVRPGLELELRSRDRVVRAPVRTVVAIGGLDTHQFELRLDLEGAAWPVGMTLRVAVPMDEVREVLAVPRDALVLRPEGVTVFVVDSNNQAQQVQVRTGVGAGDQIEVSGAISAGDTVVIRGNERLRPGQAVTVSGS